MGAIIRYENSLRVHALLLAAGAQKLRASISSESDVIELFREGNSWMTENGEVIEIESLMQIPGVEALHLLGSQLPRTMAAGPSLVDF